MGAGSVLGADPQDRKFRGTDTWLDVGDDTVIREYATLHRGTEATTITRVGTGCFLMTYVHVAHDCPSGAITCERHDGGPQEEGPSVNVLRVRENGPYAVHATIEWPDTSEFRATLCRCGRSGRKPYCDGSHVAAGFAATGEPATRPSEALAERGGRLRIAPIPDGPLQLDGNVEICTGTGRTILRTRSARLCRCGASENKPFCDGSHARVGFRSGE